MGDALLSAAALGGLALLLVAVGLGGLALIDPVTPTRVETVP